MNRNTRRMQNVEAPPTVFQAVVDSAISAKKRQLTDTHNLERSQSQTLPAAQHGPRKRRTCDKYRSLDDSWFGRAILPSMTSFTEEELALHHKLAVGEVTSHLKHPLVRSSPSNVGNEAQPAYLGLPDQDLMIVKMNRFWKRSEVASGYGIPEDLKWIVKEVPTAHIYDGEEYVYGPDVDSVIANYVPTVRPDGPHPPDTIRVAGKDYSCRSDRGWRLLQCLWGKGAVTIDKVIEEVYGHGSRQREKSLDSLVKHTRSWLRSTKCPLTIRTKSGYVELLPTGGSKGPESSAANRR